jgi:hypothetical protein
MLINLSIGLVRGVNPMAQLRNIIKSTKKKRKLFEKLMEEYPKKEIFKMQYNKYLKQEQEITETWNVAKMQHDARIL